MGVPWMSKGKYENEMKNDGNDSRYYRFTLPFLEMDTEKIDTFACTNFFHTF